MNIKLNGGSTDLHMIALVDMKKLAESIAEVNLNVFFQNALDYTEVFNQEPAKVNFFDFIKKLLAGQIPQNEKELSPRTLDGQSDNSIIE